MGREIIGDPDIPLRNPKPKTLNPKPRLPVPLKKVRVHISSGSTLDP